MRKMVLLLMLSVSFFWTTHLLAAEDEFQAAFQVVINGVIQGDTEGRRIYGLPRKTAPGMVVEGWRGSVTLPMARGFLFFVDDVPEANWEHPARLVFVNPTDGSFKVYHVRTPPKIFSEFIEKGRYQPRIRPLKPKSSVKTRKEADLQSGAAPGGRFSEETIMSSTGDNSLTIHPDHKFAVLINGGFNLKSNWPRYWNDVSFMYKTLKQKYGYKDENIYVLFADGLNPAPDNFVMKNSDVDLDGDGYPDIDFPATREDINKVFDELSRRMKAECLLFVFTTGHGGQSQPEVEPTAAYLALWDEDVITDVEFAAEVNKIKSYDTMVFVMEPCNSGGFSGELAGPGRIFTSAAAYDEFSNALLFTASGKGSWEDIENGYDAFSYYFTGALAGVCPDKRLVRADMDGDGVVSIAEAFEFASGNAVNETPQFRDHAKFAEIDPLMGANVVSPDGRFGTSFTFQAGDDVANYLIKMRGGSKLQVFVKDAPYSESYNFSDLWKVTLGDSLGSIALASGSPAGWFSPAVARGIGAQTVCITHWATIFLESRGGGALYPSLGFVKFVLTGKSRKEMTVTYMLEGTLGIKPEEIVGTDLPNSDDDE